MEGFSRPSRKVRRLIVLDTNVVSEFMLTEKDRGVVAWFNREPLDSLWLTSITVFEVQYGLALMAPGRKQFQRLEAFERLKNELLKGRVFAFDAAAGETAARFAAQRRAAGRPVEFRDAEIAGIVSARSATLATRNTRDFEGFGIDLVNPWEA
jgi:toxin FitB